MSAAHALLVLVSFVTSLVTAMVGIGGGLMLLAVMSAVLPPAAVVPVHGVTQLASNASRALLDLRAVRTRIVLSFLVGCALGATGGSRFVRDVPAEMLPLTLGIFILLLTWMPKGSIPRRMPGGFMAAGAAQTALSLFVGATGPLNAALLTRKRLSRDQTVVTHAAMMTCLHTAKILAFAGLGFAFAPYLKVMIGMVAAAFAGSWAGTRLRSRIPQKHFRVIFKGLLTLLALRGIVVYFLP